VLLTIISIATVVIGFGAVIALGFVPIIDRRDRAAEVAARDFYDAHGHWPDEPAP